MDKIDTWIKERFGTPNTFNRQLLDNFIEFLEKELGYVRKDDDQRMPEMRGNITFFNGDYAYNLAQKDMLSEHWVKVKEKSNAEG